jgi:glutamyl-Q tRNA(Asp) synthetase
MTRCGRFAPSPTGPLHLGSLATALASWLDAKAQGYSWLVRMEDLDPPREEAGAADLILRQLFAHGLTSDHVLYQSTRHPAYAAALQRLIAAGLAYPCSCSRKKLHDAHAAGLANTNADGEIIYPGFCRSLDNNVTQDAGQIGGQISWRFRNPNGDDFVIRRADGFWAYHLASVVDDAHQGITDIVRGSDLAAAAERHDALRQALGYDKPKLLHVPVMTNEAGEKLSKQTKAKPLAITPAGAVHEQLAAAWDHLQRVMPQHWISITRPSYLQLISTIKI